MANQTSAEILTLKGVRQLLKESWKLYFSKIKTLLGIMVVPVGFSLFLSFIVPLFEDFGYWILIYPISFLVSLFFQLLVIPTLLYNLKDNIGFRESYQKGLKIFKSYLWVYFLVFIITAGGFLVLIIPGILFSVWFSLAIYTLIFEEKRGMSALMRSKELVAGRWWGVFWRFLIFGLSVIVIGILISLTTFSLVRASISAEVVGQIGDIIGYFLQLFITPFALIYGFLIYKNLEKIKEKVPYKEPAKERKVKYLLPGILGFLILVVIIGLTFLNVFLGRDEPFPDDSDLWLSKIEIPKEENAFYYLAPYLSQPEKEIILEYWPEEKERLKEEREIYWPEEKEELIENIIEGKEWDAEFVKDLIKNNDQVFEDFEKAIKCPYFQDPITQDPKTVWVNTVILSLGKLRTIAKLNLIKATYLFKQGKEKEAFDGIIKVIQMGQMLE
ncbi:MAG: hypothetical protein Q8N73_01315, partial [bacterium]|nr:hypothetical protein [bacterium]